MIFGSLGFLCPPISAGGLDLEIDPLCRLIILVCLYRAYDLYDPMTEIYINNLQVQ